MSLQYSNLNNVFIANSLCIGFVPAINFKSMTVPFLLPKKLRLTGHSNKWHMDNIKSVIQEKNNKA